jgi:DNA helicase IV
VILRGGPGTGKTAVALHRVAWLLFGHRRRFGARGALVIGPNPRFTAYIDRVLPSLGEDGATLRSLGDLVSGVDARRYDAPAVAAVKGAADMADVLRRAVALGPRRAPDRLRLVHRGTVVTLDHNQLAAVRREATRTRRGPVRPNAVRGHATTQLLDAAWRRYVATVTGAGDPAPDGDARELFGDRMSDDRSIRDFMAAWWPHRTPLDVLRDLADARWLRHVAGRRLTGDAVALLAADWAGLTEHGPSYQDVALLDELADLLGDAPAPQPNAESDEDDWGVAELTTYAERMAPRQSRTASVPLDDGPAEYAHIVVDEAQDLSPMQWRMLGRRGRHATWTVVADAAQSAWQDATAAAKAMDEALGGRPRREFELSVNYRNPAEIAAVAAALLPEAQPGAVPARAVRPGGRRPELLPGTDLAGLARAAATRLLAEVDGTIGVIVADTAVTQTADWFTGLPDRVQPLGALEAKGLEFDAVVLVDAARIAAESPVGVRTLYVAVTRATQALVLVGPVTPTLRAAVG